MSRAIPLIKLATYAAPLISNLDAHRVRQMLYCMKIAGWIANHHYSNVEYYYSNLDTDPLIYRFRGHLPKEARDAARRRTDVITAIHRDLSLPKHIRQVAIAARKRPAK